MNVYDAQGKSIGLAESVGRGGEATVYRVRGQTGWLAKIYEQGPRPNYAEKLAWMIDHPPENPTRAIAHSSLAWPTGLLYDAKDRLAGYMMPHIHAAVPMLDVFNPRRRQATLPRFDRRYLHRTARNLSATLSALHARGYVVGDLNESNVLVTPSALISLIDTDSFQVQEMRGNQVVSYPCPVGKLEYTPPELHGQAIGSIVRQPEHDAFALGVLIFQLLMEGSHPFRAQWLGSGDPPPVETRISQGIFPYAAIPDSRVRPPKGAPDLNRLHPALVELVFRCFIDGHTDARQRPLPEQWEQALATAETALVQCPNSHLYSNHLSVCPHCRTAAATSKTDAARQPASAPAGASQSTSGASWRSPGVSQRSSGFSQRSPGTPPAGQKPPKQQSKPRPQPRTQPSPQPRTQSRPAGPNPAFRSRRPSSTNPGFNWQAFIASRMNTPWPRASYPSGVAYPTGAPYPSSPPSPPPSRPYPGAQPWRGFTYHPGSVKAWVSPRLSKSVLVGGGLGALIGALIGGLAGLASASLGEIAAWTLLWALGGAAAGVSRGWKPGYRMSMWVDRNIGWHRLLPVFGLLAGAMLGMLLGFIIGWWAIIPVFVGMFYGARLGKRAGHKVVVMGSRIGWDRLWAGFSAVVAALVGLRIAVWLGGGPVGGLVAQGADSLSAWLLGMFSGSAPEMLITAVVSGALCGGLAGAVTGVLTDLVARLSGLVD